MKVSRETPAVFCQAQNEPGTENSTLTELDVQFPPQILSSSNCTGDSSQISCVCETEGNPFPLIQWSFPGVSPNISISSEPLSDKALRSVLTVIKPQWKDSVTLVCHSSNSLGSDRSAFDHETQAFQQSGIWAEVTLLLLITIIVILLVLMGVLLFVLRAQNVRYNKRQSADAALNQIPLSNELQEEIQRSVNDSSHEVFSEAESNIYANANEMRAEERSESSKPDNNEGSDQASTSALYASVNWKTKSKKKVQEAAADTQPPCGSYLEEQRSIVGDKGKLNVCEKLVECDYAQVKFKPRKPLQ
ncbi:uncharacterized protein [Eucyclogobius newberryi]|uniref:uncharacterized protein n=1 Tax=Eucyclogobius newberryi TaxID=166745 RepID=UPI003B5C4E27